MRCDALCVRAAQASESRRASWHRRVVRMRKEAAAEGPTRARARRCLTRRCQFDARRWNRSPPLSCIARWSYRGQFAPSAPRTKSTIHSRGFLSFSRYFFSDGKQALAAFADRFERCSTRNRCITHPLHRLSSAFGGETYDRVFLLPRYS